MNEICSAAPESFATFVGTLPLSEIARVLVRLDYVASFIVNLNHSIA